MEINEIWNSLMATDCGIIPALIILEASLKMAEHSYNNQSVGHWFQVYAILMTGDISQQDIHDVIEGIIKRDGQ